MKVAIVTTFVGFIGMLSLIFHHRSGHQARVVEVEYADHVKDTFRVEVYNGGAENEIGFYNSGCLAYHSKEVRRKILCCNVIKYNILQ